MKGAFNADPADFSPPLLRIQQKPPPPLAGVDAAAAARAARAACSPGRSFGRLDIVAVADGKLVPSTYLKIVQPAEQGIVQRDPGEGRPGGAGRGRC